MHIFDKILYNKILRDARCAARDAAGTEICGLIIDTGYILSFVPTHNVSSRAGSFALSRADVRRIAAAAKILGQQIVGTYHSHPAATATPGKSDIRYALNDSLMFIFDCIGRKGKLWRIKNGKARQLSFCFFQDANMP
jgi:proteasome lid subunit RPN8/RPN11